MPELIVTVLATLGGVVLGTFLTRRNERRATGDRLLAEALDDIVGGMNDAANRMPARRRATHLGCLAWPFTVGLISLGSSAVD